MNGTFASSSLHGTTTLTRIEAGSEAKPSGRATTN